jgi:hypothetical protein
MTRRESQELRHLELVVSRIEEQKIDLTADYKDWMSICFACATLEEEKGRELLHRICRFYPKYSQAECDQKYDYCKKGGRGEIHLASIFELAKKHGVDISMPKGRRKKEGEDEEAMTRSELVVEFLKGKPIRYDVVSRKNQIQREGQWVELKERDRNTLLYECCKWAKKDISSNLFQDMLHSDVITLAHPLREYVTSQPAWDPSQPDYLAQVAAMVHVQPSSGRNIQALWEECFKKWFVAMVASWMVDEIVNHQVLVLIGEQGIFKTSWLDFLIPEALKEYRCKQSGSDRLDKDEQLRATEFALINLDEIDKLTERELNATKSLITATDVNVRVAYGTSKERYVRLASYVASGNKDKFLTDNTGNRRWLPFRVERIDSPYTTHFPYAGMYAQALYLFQHQFSYWFDQDKIRDMSSHVNEFMVESMEEQLIQVYFAPAKPGDANAKFLTTAEISSRLISYGNIRHPMDIRALSAILRKLGFIGKRDKTHSHRGFLVIEKTTAEIEMARKQLAMDEEVPPVPDLDSEEPSMPDSDKTFQQIPDQDELPF